jgi:hypothetical protein
MFWKNIALSRPEKAGYVSQGREVVHFPDCPRFSPFFHPGPGKIIVIPGSRPRKNDDTLRKVLSIMLVHHD